MGVGSLPASFSSLASPAALVSACEAVASARTSATALLVANWGGGNGDGDCLASSAESTRRLFAAEGPLLKCGGCAMGGKGQGGMAKGKWEMVRWEWLGKELEECFCFGERVFGFRNGFVIIFTVGDFFAKFH
jgi:hypothetical protein